MEDVEQPQVISEKKIEKNEDVHAKVIKTCITK